MANYTLTIKRKKFFGGESQNPPITITTPKGEYIIANGQTLSISLPEGEHTLIFTCNFKMRFDDSTFTDTRELDFELTADSIMELSASIPIINIEKFPVPIVEISSDNKLKDKAGKVIDIFKSFLNVHGMAIFFYSIIISFLVIIFIAFNPFKTGNNTTSCSHASCKENGPFHCYGKNNTCPNYTYCYKDLYCDECD